MPDFNLVPLDSMNRHTGGSLRWPKKSSKEMLTREGICMLIWDGPKFEPFSFSLISARNISHMSILRLPTFYSPKTLRWPRIRREMEFEAKMVRILGHLRVLGFKKVGHPRTLTCDWYFEPKSKRNWMVRILGHLRFECLCLHGSTSP